jgi:hypothetical protein
MTFGFEGMGMGTLVEDDDRERAEGREMEVWGL